jgi:hypothetical protein
MHIAVASPVTSPHSQPGARGLQEGSLASAGRVHYTINVNITVQGPGETGARRDTATVNVLDAVREGLLKGAAL